MRTFVYECPVSGLRRKQEEIIEWWDEMLVGMIVSETISIEEVMNRYRTDLLSSNSK